MTLSNIKTTVAKKGNFYSAQYVAEKIRWGTSEYRYHVWILIDTEYGTFLEACKDTLEKAMEEVKLKMAFRSFHFLPSPVNYDDCGFDIP